MASTDETAPGPGPVSLREVRDEDLPLLFAHQADAGAAAMVGFASRDRPAFDLHWTRIRREPSVLLRTVAVDGVVAGHVLCFDRDGRREVGYWLDRAFWGRGIAAVALAQLLVLEPQRPLYGHLLRTNLGSRRVLERNGFTYLEDIGDDDIILVLRS